MSGHPRHPGSPEASAPDASLNKQASLSGGISGGWAGTITLKTSDDADVPVDVELLTASSKFWSDMLSSVTDHPGQVQVDEPKDTLELLIQVMRGQAPARTFDELDDSCWNMYKRILIVADKYDMPVVRERCEKWLVSRCLRGKVRCADFKFHDVSVAIEWLALCQKYSLRCLGWYVSYDLGMQLAAGCWPGAHSVNDVCSGVSDAEFLKVMLEAVADSVRVSQASALRRRSQRTPQQPVTAGAPVAGGAHVSDQDADGQ